MDLETRERAVDVIAQLVVGGSDKGYFTVLDELLDMIGYESLERERDELKRQLAEANATCAAMREAVELLREIQSAGVSFEDERVAYVEIQVHKETLKAIDAFLKRGTGKEV